MRLLVVFAVMGCGGGVSPPDSGPPPLTFGSPQQATIGGPGAYAINLSTGTIGTVGDIQIGSNFEVGGWANAYIAAVGPVASTTDVVFPAMDGYARSANAPTGEGLAVRAADGCPVAVHVIEHTDTGLSGGNMMTFEYARASCNLLRVAFHPMAQSVTCNPGWLKTGPPSIAFQIAGYPPIEGALSATMDTAFALAIPPGVTVTPTLRDATPLTPSTVMWSGACTGSTCSLTSDAQPSATAVVTWTPMCFPGP
jgi:hypothetical protein